MWSSTDLLFIMLFHILATDKPYMAEAKNGQDTYFFYLNVCGETSAGQCGDDKGYISACQFKETGDVKKIAGRFQNQTLRFGFTLVLFVTVLHIP